MKVAIVYDSMTGNTKMLADVIKEEVQKDCEVIYCDNVKDNLELEVDLYIIGSWTDRGSCSKKISNFVKNIHKKDVLYFATAGYGGSKDYYEQLYSRFINDIGDNKGLGYYICQGKMPMAIRDKYVKLMTANKEDKKLQVSLENFDKALAHPDYYDLSSAKLWINNILKNIM